MLVSQSGIQNKNIDCQNRFSFVCSIAIFNLHSMSYDDDNILQGTALSWTGTLDRRIQLGTQVILLQMLIVFVQIEHIHLSKLTNVFVQIEHFVLVFSEVIWQSPEAHHFHCDFLQCFSAES